MRKRLIIGTTFAALLAVLAAVFLTHGNKPTSSTSVTNRISSNEVRLSNLNTFEAQVRHDIPLGTPRSKVEAYLSQQNIPHGFAEPEPALIDQNIQNAFYGTIKGIGVRWGFPASLAIRIHLDGNEKVDKIWFRVDYDAP